MESAPEALGCSAALAAASDGKAFFLENLIPAPADTTSVVPPPLKIDPVLKSHTALPDGCEATQGDTHEEFDAYYRKHFKTHSSIWEPIHAKFAPHWSGPLGPNFDLHAMVSSLDEFETNLYNIDGPQPTWHLKKSMRQRVQLMRDKINSAKTFDETDSNDIPDASLWITARHYELSVGDRIRLAASFHDDTEPRRLLSCGSYGNVKHIDEDGDFNIELDDKTTCWVFRNRCSVLVRQTCRETVLHEFRRIRDDYVKWKSRVMDQ